MGLEAAFVDLAPVGDPGLIASSIAAALAIRPGPSQTVEDALIEDLRDRSLLLVLDNLEQLLPEAGPVSAGSPERARASACWPPAGHRSMSGASRST